MLNVRVLSKIRAHGIDGILCWNRIWLGERQTGFAAVSSDFEWGHVTSGVLQGSVLGPLPLYLSNLLKLAITLLRLPVIQRWVGLLDQNLHKYPAKMPRSNESVGSQMTDIVQQG